MKNVLTVVFIFVSTCACFGQATIKIEAPFPMKDRIVPHFPDKDFIITGFGAKQDDKVSCSDAIKKAIEACYKNGGGRVVIPAGSWLTGPIHLKSNINLHIAENAILKFSDVFEDYLPVVFTRWEGFECYNYSPLIYAIDCQNIAVTGKGKLDGNGQKWWPWARLRIGAQKLYDMVLNKISPDKRVFGTTTDAMRPSFVQFVNCKQILFQDFTISSGPMWTIHPVYSDNIIAQRVHVVTSGPNNDGFDIESSTNVLIEDCFFETGDDCVVLKSGMNEDGWRVNKPVENIVVRNIFTKIGHGGVVFGSDVSGGIRNVYVYDCYFDGTLIGIRMKSMRGRGGFVENVWVNNVGMRNITQQPFQLTMFYNASTLQPASTAPSTFRNFHFENIYCEGADSPFLIEGLPEKNIENITMKNISITSAKKRARINDAKNISFDGLYLGVNDSIACRMNDVQDISFKNITLAGNAKTFIELSGEKTKNVTMEHVNLPFVEKRLNMIKRK
jgi:polygalacturonase